MSCKIPYLIVFLLLLPIGMTVPVSAADGTKLDVGIYAGLNPRDNPIDADPWDTAEFTFSVYWVVVKTLSSGEEISREDVKVGDFSSTQQNAAHFPLLTGIPYSDTYCSGYKVGGLCIGTLITETGYYHIGYVSIPYGYCPQYPQGQDRKKSDTQTSNLKFFKGSVCNMIYPGFHGLFGWEQCRPNKCMILLR